jgi:DNA modification methylase
MLNRVIFGDCRDSMREMKAQGVKVQMCVTSPPYFGLRDYGHSGQLGLEPTTDKYVAAMVEVFSLVWELLVDDGVIFVNLGDSYAGSGPSGASYRSKTTVARDGKNTDGAFRISKTLGERGLTYAEKKPIPPPGLKPKDLIGIPWRVAFALQAAGWYLRQDIIWHKPNPMPESVTDRCTKAHEYLFLLAKSERYYFDNEAIKELATSTNPKIPWQERTYGTGQGVGELNGDGSYKRGTSRQPCGNTDDGMKNKRSVWTIPTKPYAGAHFATFPPALIEPCILAGSRPGDVVLDPFMGSGTTAQVAQELCRQWIGCELNPDYEALIQERTSQACFAI